MFIGYTGNSGKKLKWAQVETCFLRATKLLLFFPNSLHKYLFLMLSLLLIQNEIIYVYAYTIYIIYLFIHLNWSLEASHLRRLSTCHHSQMTIQTEPEPQAIRRVASPVAQNCSVSTQRERETKGREREREREPSACCLCLTAPTQIQFA